LTRRIFSRYDSISQAKTRRNYVGSCQRTASLLLMLYSHTELNETIYTLILSSMNLDETVELLRIVSEIPVKKSAKRPEIRVFCAIDEVMAKGYAMRIEKDSVDADYRNHLNSIVESKKLTIRESKGYLVIYRKSV
jgi:hypothetical protein